MAETERKRIFIGGLFSAVSEEDLKQRFSKFGEIHKVNIKIRKDDSGLPSKTFAYLDGSFTDASLKKCFSTYNKNKWKGSELSLQLAKESFLEKLKREREIAVSHDATNATNPTESSSPVAKVVAKGVVPGTPVANEVVKGAVPGTPVPGERNWVVGKYGRTLPIVFIRRKDKKKVAKMDPSKYCHNLKKLKDDDSFDQKARNLTWELAEKSSVIWKQRQGQFPEYKPKKRPKREPAVSPEFNSETSEPQLTGNPGRKAQNIKRSDGLEVVKIKPLPKPLSLGEKMQRIAGMNLSRWDEVQRNESDDSAATDEIIASTKLSVDESNSVMQTPISFSSSADKRPMSKKKRRRVDENHSFDSKRNREDSKSIRSPQNVHEKNENLPENFERKVKKQAKISDISVEGDRRRKSQKTIKLAKPPPFRGTTQFVELDENMDLSDDDSESSSCVENVTPRKGKPPQFKGTSHMSDKMESCSPVFEKLQNTNKLSERRDAGNSLDKKTANPALKKLTISSSKNSPKSSEKVSVGSKKQRDSSTINKDNSLVSVGFLTSNRKDSSLKLDHSVLMSEFSSGLLPEGFPCDQGKSSSSSESDYDSEDYERLAKKTPKFFKTNLLTNDQPFSSDLKRTGNKKLLKDLATKVYRSDTDSSETDSDSENEIEDTIKIQNQVLTPDVSAIENRNSSLFATNKLDDRETTERESVGPKMSFSDNLSKKFTDLPELRRLQSTSTPKPLPVHKSKRDNSSTDQASQESSLSLDDFSTRFLANASDLSSDGSISSESHSDEDISGDSISSESFKNIADRENEGNLKNRSSHNGSEVNSCGMDIDSEDPMKKSIASGTTVIKSSPNKKCSDNQKRLESLRQRQKETLSQKSAIQQALKSVDSLSQTNKKIVFSSDEEDAGDGNKSKAEGESFGGVDLKVSKQVKKTEQTLSAKLFESSDDSDTDDGSSQESVSDAEMFQIKPHFQGPAGKKLMDLQSRFGNDPRFKLDQRFLDPVEPQDAVQEEGSEETEKSRMLKILRDVVGEKVTVEPENSKKIFKGAVRYDPNKEDHKQFEVRGEKVKKVKITELSDESLPMGQRKAKRPVEVIPEVSKERFFEVTSTLTEVFGRSEVSEDKPSATGFSLLAAFGQPEEDLEIDTKGVTGEAKPLQGRKTLFPWQQQLVQDSSDDEAEVTMETEEAEVTAENYVNKTKSMGEEVEQTDPEKTDSFFIQPEDPRFKEGVQFFCRQGDLETIREKWLEDRPRLVESYRSVHKRVSRRVKTALSKRGRRPATLYKLR